jgi:shikimate kinase
MKHPNRVFLVGPMGAGKTTLGRHLARTLKVGFVDSDQEIERRTGADIPWIFDIEGEEGFRKRETEAIEDLTLREGIVLATGGGAVLKPENRDFLRSRGLVVYLYASVDKLFARTGKDRNRPLLQTDDPKAKLESLMEVRDPLYREVADIVIDTGAQTLRQTVDAILRDIKKRAKSDSKSAKNKEKT